MQNGGPIDPDVAGFGQARKCSMECDLGIDLLLLDPPPSMRARRDEQWSIPVGYLIQMDPDRQHSLDELKGWLDMIDAVLPVPFGEAVDIGALGNGDCAILMPTKGPV